jgi:hypothetical protein
MFVKFARMNSAEIMHGDGKGMKKARIHLVRSAYQPPASITFLSEQISHQPTVLFSQNKPAISHQPNEQTD